MRAKDYNKINWHEYFAIDETSKSGLNWIVPKYYNGTPNYDRVGENAGSVVSTRNCEYWVVGFSFGTYLIHRILWVMMNGQVDTNSDIDHIDGNGLNNSHENLRCVTKSVNGRNRSRRCDNRSGETGIFYETTRTGQGYRACVVDENGVKHRKFFSLVKYDNAKELAILWKESKLKELNNAGYTSRHGL